MKSLYEDIPEPKDISSKSSSVKSDGGIIQQPAIFGKINEIEQSEDLKKSSNKPEEPRENLKKADKIKSNLRFVPSQLKNPAHIKRKNDRRSPQDSTISDGSDSKIPKSMSESCGNNALGNDISHREAYLLEKPRESAPGLRKLPEVPVEPLLTTRKPYNVKKPNDYFDIKEKLLQKFPEYQKKDLEEESESEDDRIILKRPLDSDASDEHESPDNNASKKMLIEKETEDSKNQSTEYDEIDGEPLNWDILSQR